MFEGQRLSYIVPGYTGYIPPKQQDLSIYSKKFQKASHVPGYAGYVHAIKPQNLHANTFGKITSDVNHNTFIKGQDLPPRHKYVSTQADTNIPPSQMLQRTAADIVGVPNTKIRVQQPQFQRKQGDQIDQFTIAKDEQFRQSMRNTQNKWARTHVTEKQGKQYVQIGNPLPGYTGFQKRVIANNIFGKTFAECLNSSVIDSNKLDHDKKKNFNTQLNSQPPFKF